MSGKERLRRCSVRKNGAAGQGAKKSVARQEKAGHSISVAARRPLCAVLLHSTLLVKVNLPSMILLPLRTGFCFLKSWGSGRKAALRPAADSAAPITCLYTSLLLRKKRLRRTDRTSHRGFNVFSLLPPNIAAAPEGCGWRRIRAFSKKVKTGSHMTCTSQGHPAE